MPTDPNMTGLVYPTEDSDTDIWDTILNTTVFPVIGAHDHTTGKGVKVPSAGLKINADLSCSFAGSNYALTDLKAIDFAAVTAASVAGYAGALFVNSSDANNLYFRTIGGTNVKITDGTTLNVSIVGGIGGDYSSIGALLDYDDATDTYRFRQETAAAVRQFAKIKSADIKLYEYLASGASPVPSFGITIKSPAALAGDLTLTLPALAPAFNSLFLQATTAGVLSWSNTTTQDITAPDVHLTTAQTHNLGPAAFQAYEAAGGAVASTWNLNNPVSSPHYWQMGNHTAAYLVKALDVKVGDQITGFTGRFNKGSDNTCTLSMALRKVTIADGTSAAVDTQSSTATGTLTLTSGALTETVAAGFSYELVIQISDSTPSSTDLLYGATYTAKRP